VCSDILIAGANGMLGRHVVRAIGHNRAIAATRRQNYDDPKVRHIAISDVRTLSRDLFDRVGTIINAAGSVTGSNSELHQANVGFPVALARIARDGGARRFVQVSSFAVYGAVEFIEASTPSKPKTFYGETKAEAERQLLALSTTTFSVVCLRIPFLFGPEQPALIGQLLKIGRLLPFVPVDMRTKRSMLTYAHAAQVLQEAADSGIEGVLSAADPQFFDFSLLNRLILEGGRNPLRTLELPSPVVTMLGKLAPTIHRRLFLSSALDPAANFASTPSSANSVEGAIRAIVQRTAS
jgi:nucleoside-diphosphate-sugar epimerase